MKSIKVKLKEPLPHDEELQKKKNFNTVLSNYREIESSYRSTSTFISAIAGILIFVGLVTHEVLQQNSNVEALPENKLQSDTPVKKEKKIPNSGLSPSPIEQLSDYNEFVTPNETPVASVPPKELKTETSSDTITPSQKTNGKNPTLSPEINENRNKVIQIEFEP